MDTLTGRIEQLRQELYLATASNKLTSDVVVSLSKELDQLLNKNVGVTK